MNKKLVVILFFSICLAFGFRHTQRNLTLSRFLQSTEYICSIIQLKMQTQSYREASETIETILSSKKSMNTGFTLNIPLKIDLSPMEKGSFSYEKKCAIVGRPDVSVSFFLNRGDFLNPSFFKSLFFSVIICLFLIIIFQMILRRFQKIVGEQILIRLSHDLELRDSNRNGNKDGIFNYFLLKEINFGAIKKDVEKLKKTIQQQAKLISENSLKLLKVEEQKRISDAKNEIAHQVAHDIKSPIGSIKVGLQNIDRKPEASLSLIESAHARIESIVEDLTKNRSDTLDKKEKMEATSIVELVKEICFEKKQEHGSQLETLKINHSMEAENSRILVAPSTLKRIISNIINNSVEASKKSCEIRIDIAADESALNLVISDNGIGIPTELREKVFEKGFSSGKESGEGLGLYHAKEKLSQMGGSIVFIESIYGTGTTVMISLPKN